MARYVDLDKQLVRLYLLNLTCKDVIKEFLLSANVVEVVQCRECVHHINAPKTTGVWCERVDGLLPKDWFCADGERRTDDDRNG